MINIVFTVFSLAVLVVAVVSRGQVDNSDVNKQVLSAEINSEAQATETPLATSTPTATAEATLTPKPTAFKTLPPSSTPSTKPELGNISAWLHSPLSVQKQTETELTFTTGESAKQITSWYRDKIKSLNFNITNDIQAQSNDKISNTISGHNSNGSVKVEITQENSGTPVLVKVLLGGSAGGTVNSSVNISI